MATDDDADDDVEAVLYFETRYGNDSTPLMASVPEPPPTHWGVTTSTARTLSPQYIAFLNRHKETSDNG